MPAKYDRIFKENIEELVVPLIKKVLAIDFEVKEELADDFHVTLERKPDFLKRVRPKGANVDAIFHMEFQSSNDNRMDKRMLMYYSLGYDIYGLVPKQYVFYIGEEPMNMPTRIVHEKLQFSYEIIDLRNVDYHLFLEGDTPEEVVLSILGGFGKAAPAEVIRQILKKLVQLSEKGKRIQKHIRQLEVLAKLRSLQIETVKQINNMPLTYDLSTDVRFLQGEEKGIKKGIRITISQILTSEKFKSGKLTLQDVADMTNSTLEVVTEIWQEVASNP